MRLHSSMSLLAALSMLGLVACHHRGPNRSVPNYSADGRMPLDQLLGRYKSLSTEHGWESDTVYSYPPDDKLHILSWHTRERGNAIWILAGIHGEEPAGPNAIARTLDSISALADEGVPI